MGGSDYGGSIEQLIMDREVILIGSSLSEDTRRGASDSESSSFERVRVSRRTDGAFLTLKEGYVPSVVAEELVPVTVILPRMLLGV